MWPMSEKRRRDFYRFDRFVLVARPRSEVSFSHQNIGVKLQRLGLVDMSSLSTVYYGYIFFCVRWPQVANGKRGGCYASDT